MRKLLYFRHTHQFRHIYEEYWFGNKSAVFNSTSYGHLVTTGRVYDPRRNTLVDYNCAVSVTEIATAQCSTTLTPNGVILTNEDDVYTQDFLAQDVAAPPTHYAKLPRADLTYRLYSYDDDLYAFEDRSRDLYVLKSGQSPPRSWSRLPAMSHKRLAPYVVITETHVYAIGGQYHQDGFKRDGSECYEVGVEHEVFSIATGEWALIHATDCNRKTTPIKLPSTLQHYTLHRESNKVFYFNKDSLMQMDIRPERLYVSIHTKVRVNMENLGLLTY